MTQIEAIEKLEELLTPIWDGELWCGAAAVIDILLSDPDIAQKALGYESFLHHGNQHQNNPTSSKCYPGCGQAWRNPKELIQ